MRVDKFEDLTCWKEGRILANMVYELTKGNIFKKDFGLVDQIRRSSVSVISNIAEGFERKTNNELRQFLYIAKSSCGEIRAQIYIAYDQKYINEDKFLETIEQCTKTSKLLSSFIKYLNKEIK